ncbi:MAG: hypothetical protein IKJ45_02845, partial [Kiritimatiellae bacterium]|nr:hypothetical protein [Kiritimatiellia bacterium]
PTWRNGEYFYGGDYADNTAVPVFKEVEVAAVIPAATPDGWDEMSAVTGRVFVAQNPEQFTYDADGNMTSDGRFRYTWNGENRLVRAQELCAPTNRNPYTLTYAYDHRGRMVSKRITENNGNDTLVKSVSYLWDGWNIIREIQWPVASGQWPVVTDNVWGLDLDGTMQGAGGVGGLLAVQRSDCSATNSSLFTLHSSLYFPTYDANGNVSEYVSTDGSIVAHYDYSPFGETLIESGDLASTFTHRFSTKPWCQVTGLYEYQMRKYRPEIGRWLSRDQFGRNEFEGEQIPVAFKEEKNGVDNLLDLETSYGYVSNAVIFNYDILGARGAGSKWRQKHLLKPVKRVRDPGAIGLISIGTDLYYREHSYEKIVQKGWEKCEAESPQNNLRCRCCVIFYSYTSARLADELFYFDSAHVFPERCEKVQKTGFIRNRGQYEVFLPW